MVSKTFWRKNFLLPIGQRVDYSYFNGISFVFLLSSLQSYSKGQTMMYLGMIKDSSITKSWITNFHGPCDFSPHIKQSKIDMVMYNANANAKLFIY